MRQRGRSHFIRLCVGIISLRHRGRSPFIRLCVLASSCGIGDAPATGCQERRHPVLGLARTFNRWAAGRGGFSLHRLLQGLARVTHRCTRLAALAAQCVGRVVLLVSLARASFTEKSSRPLNGLLVIAETRRRGDHLRRCGHFGIAAISGPIDCCPGQIGAGQPDGSRPTIVGVLGGPARPSAERGPSLPGPRSFASGKPSVERGPYQGRFFSQANQDWKPIKAHPCAGSGARTRCRPTNQPSDVGCPLDVDDSELLRRRRQRPPPWSPHLHYHDGACTLL